jgi:hypothetical protein
MVELMYVIDQIGKGDLLSVNRSALGYQFPAIKRSEMNESMPRPTIFSSRLISYRV